MPHAFMPSVQFVRQVYILGICALATAGFVASSRAPISSVSTTPTNITFVANGGSLALSWPADHTGWRLLAQTNRLAMGPSTNLLDWETVPASYTTNRLVIPLGTAGCAEFYRLVYP
jgi:hypothetical protein